MPWCFFHNTAFLGKILKEQTALAMSCFIDELGSIGIWQDEFISLCYIVGRGRYHPGDGIVKRKGTSTDRWMEKQVVVCYPIAF